MVEAKENPDIVTLKRQRDLEESQRAYREGMTQQSNAANQSPTLNVQPIQSSTQQPEIDPPPADPNALFRHTRLAIVALLVVILVIAWFRQKKNAT